jgi:glycosyltransferase involved in cell wall biosynthesis
MPVSAVIPVKDGARFIAGALDSLCNQGHVVSEILVVNNGSTDATAEIVLQYPDPRVRLLNSDIPNLPLSRNIGAAEAQSKWLYFLDADDRVLPGAVDRLLAVGEKSQDLAVVYGDYCRLDEAGKRIGSREILPNWRKPTGDMLSAFLTSNKMIVGAQIIQTDWFRRVGCFKPDIPFCEDWEFWCRMACHAKFEFVPDLVVLGYTMNRSSMSHYQTIPFSRFGPMLDAIFSNPDIATRPDCARMRQRAEASCLTYVCTEAVRMGAHRDAGRAFLRAIARDPKRLAQNSAKYLGAYLNL